MASEIKIVYFEKTERIPAEVEKFRQDNKSQSLWYSAKAHYIATTCLSLPLIIYALYKFETLKALDFLVIPIFILFATLFEYLVHRYLLHRQVWFFKTPYVEHTLRHHFFFTHQAIEATQSADFERVFFPVWGVALIQYTIVLPASFVIGYFFSHNAGYLSLVIGALFFFLYETIHMITHLPRKYWVFKIPGMLFLREHHRAHHHKGKMAKNNFNIVLPVWDVIFGTRIMLKDQNKDDESE